MTDDAKPLKIEFAPGCFDDFDGTQDELNDMMAEITAGKIEKSRNFHNGSH